MNETMRLNYARTVSECEKLWAAPDARVEIGRRCEEAAGALDGKIMVLDDDPTGVQTVHDIDVVTRWDEATLKKMFSSDERMFFVLTNSRSFSAQRTAEVHREIARNAVRAAASAGRGLMVISRGDSTLRGHYPLETRVLREALGDGIFGEVLCPFFAEGGRYTLDGVHYVRDVDALVPAALTEFARDRTFGYAHSYLPEYIAEKSDGAIRAEQVEVVRLAELRGMDFEGIERRLAARDGYAYIVADALEEADVRAMAIVLTRLARKGRRYLMRSAAAVPKVWGRVSDRPLLSRSELMRGGEASGGLVVVGSHVKKTTDQLEYLRASALPLEFIEFDVSKWTAAGGLEGEAVRAATAAERAMREGRTAVVYTSRTLLAPSELDAEALLAFSVCISDALTRVVAILKARPRFLIAKGGITSSDVGVKGLGVVRARVLGQVAPGVPVWWTGPESRFPGLSYVIFPGNVGSVETLRDVVEKLA